MVPVTEKITEEEQVTITNEDQEGKIQLNDKQKDELVQLKQKNQDRRDALAEQIARIS